MNKNRVAYLIAGTLVIAVVGFLFWYRASRRAALALKEKAEVEVKARRLLCQVHALRSEYTALETRWNVVRKVFANLFQSVGSKNTERAEPTIMKGLAGFAQVAPELLR